MNTDDMYRLIVNELKNPSLDLSIEYAEIGINTFANSDLIDKIPLIKSIKLIYDLGVYFRERRFFKNICIFLKDYSDGNIDEQKKNNFLKKLESSKEKEKIIDFILLYLEKEKIDEKVFLFSGLFKKYIEGLIDWDEFCFLSDCIEKAYINDLNTLTGFLTEDSDVLKKEANSSSVRLVSLGLLDTIYEIATMPGNSPMKVFHIINEMGMTIAEVINEINVN